MNLTLKYDSPRLWVCIEFKRKVKQYTPKSIIADDVNFDNVTMVLMKGERIVKVKRFKFPLKRTLTHRIWIERMQKRYPKQWKCIKGIRESIRKHGRRARNIINDSCHKIADEITDIAVKHRGMIVVENLKYVKENVKRNNTFNKKLSLWAYCRLLSYIEYECFEKEVPLVKVNPKGTSKICPRCGSEPTRLNGRIMRYSKCGFIGIET